MKTIFSFLLSCIISLSLSAQMPQSINYQAVARNNAGVAISNQTIKVRLSIVTSAAGNPVLYSETRSVTTNLLGLFNVQIGSAGAISTTGNFSTISWANNTPNTKLIKVEIDINNTNVFTDLGTQPLSTVPYAYASGEAINAINIGGNYVATSTPVTGDLLKWDGSAWLPSAAPTAPKIYSISGQIGSIAAGNAGAPWVFAGTTQTLTVAAGQYITANFNGSFGHLSNSTVPVSVAVCYSEVPVGSPLNAFQGITYIDATVFAQPVKTLLPATGAINLPAGQYKIGMCMKNKSPSVALSTNDYMNGTIVVF